MGRVGESGSGTKQGSPVHGMWVMRKNKMHTMFSQIPDRSRQHSQGSAQPRASLAAPSTSSFRSPTAGVPRGSNIGAFLPGALF